MADFAFNNGSFGMAFEPLRDEGPPAHGGFRPSRPVAGGGVELREARAFSTPVAGALALAPAPAGSTAKLRSRPTAAPLRRTASLTTRMPAPSATRLNQIVQHVTAQTPAGHPRGTHRTSAFGAAPAELGGELPTENYALEY